MGKDRERPEVQDLCYLLITNIELLFKIQSIKVLYTLREEKLGLYFVNQLILVPEFCENLILNLRLIINLVAFSRFSFLFSLFLIFYL